MCDPLTSCSTTRGARSCAHGSRTAECWSVSSCGCKRASWMGRRWCSRRRAVRKGRCSRHCSPTCTCTRGWTRGVRRWYTPTAEGKSGCTATRTMWSLAASGKRRLGGASRGTKTVRQGRAGDQHGKDHGSPLRSPTARVSRAPARDLQRSGLCPLLGQNLARQLPHQAEAGGQAAPPQPGRVLALVPGEPPPTTPGTVRLTGCEAAGVFPV